MALDQKTLWQAFTSGAWGDYTEGALTGTQAEDESLYGKRVRSFYDYVIGPSFGYQDPSGAERLFGGAFPKESFQVGSERTELESAEREFRTAIGDPYGEGGPFAWENISRYETYPNALGEAYELLGGELYGQGESLGGELGSEYATSMEEQEESYTTGMGTQREALTHGALTAGIGLASGTSGATLRSGSAVGQAEDILTEAYQEAKELGAGFKEGRVTTEEELGSNLRGALKTYLAAIDEEKSEWYQNILQDVRRIQSYQGLDPWDPGYESAFEEARKTFEELDPTGAWGALEYTGEEGYQFREDGACGIGELYIDGECILPEESGITYNEYGEIVGTGEGHYASQGCMTGGDCGNTNDPNVKIHDESQCLGPPSVTCWDLSVVCNEEECTEDTREEDCAGVKDGDAVVDECGVCDGDGSTCAELGCGPGEPAPSFTCWDLSVVCSEAECPIEERFDECGVLDGPGPRYACWDGEWVCDMSMCNQPPGGGVSVPITRPDPRHNPLEDKPRVVK